MHRGPKSHQDPRIILAPTSTNKTPTHLLWQGRSRKLASARLLDLLMRFQCLVWVVYTSPGQARRASALPFV